MDGIRDSIKTETESLNYMTKIQNIQIDTKRKCSKPHYITENIKDEFCVSDKYKQALLVVDKSGKPRFSYTGQRSEFFPNGICTDVLSHILMCDCISKTVHLLGQNGKFLYLLLTEQQGVYNPCTVCVNDENNIWVGKLTNTVTVFKYLQ